MNDFARRLGEWHREHGRHDLPWQNTRDPYRIWLSEIMLQQTRVESVIPYYARFLQRFPDLPALADAPLDAVLGLWSGLGYYARARNLHRAARIIMTEHGGRFPHTAEGIAALPGIGRSTAAAIAAFAFGERAAILDGNVKRVLCRVFGIGGFPGQTTVASQLWLLAESLLPRTGIAAYIQAQMDLGATVCTRTRPACENCPLASGCIALRERRVADLPATRPRKAIPLKSIRVAVIQWDDRVLMERRAPSGIWGGLLGLPEIPDSRDDSDWLLCRFGIAAGECIPLPPLRHAFTHFRLDIHPVRLRVDRIAPMIGDAGHEWLALGGLDGAGVPAPVRRILAACRSGGACITPSRDPADRDTRE